MLDIRDNYDDVICLKAAEFSKIQKYKHVEVKTYFVPLIAPKKFSV